MLGFTYSLRAPPEDTATSETITMVRNGSADMAASWITITADRSEYVSFTYPYYDLYISFVYKPTVSDSVREGGKAGSRCGFLALHHLARAPRSSGVGFFFSFFTFFEWGAFSVYLN